MAKTQNKFNSTTRKGLWILVVAAVVLEVTACIQYFFTRNALRVEVEKRAKTELRRAELEVEKHTVEMETAAQMLAMLAEKHVNQPDSVYAATRAIVSTLANTSSVAVAYIPNYFPQHGIYFEACSSRISADSVYTRQIGSAEHDYTQLEWFQNGLQKDTCWWSEPYLDDSGSQTMVVSCSCPVHDANGNIVAVVCVDLSLDYLQTLSKYLQMYQGSYYSIRSSKGEDIVAQPDTIPGRRYEIFDEEIDATGWHISIIIPEDVIYADLKRVGLIVSILMLLGLALLVFIMLRSAKNLINVVTLSNQQERLEGELTIARNIQMAMLPTRFPPFEDVPNINAFGVVVPAREVGGDLFDFYIRENRLFFCIGDVSGKGVPAALVMAVTRSLFRSFTSYMDSPAQIVTQMNNSLSGEENEQSMFVTFFLGILDLHTGALQYCNAGHNKPVLLSTLNAQLSTVDCISNLPLGVLNGFAYEEQTIQLTQGDTLFLYTDGLTEAENTSHELFGEQRMNEQLMRFGEQLLPPRDIIRQMQDAITAFVDKAPQSDDLTMFVIRFPHTLVMRNDIQQIPTLAEWIDSLELPMAVSMPVNLALEEAVSNVMLYAYPEKQDGQVLVEAVKSPTRVVFTITDAGKPFDPTAQEEPDLTLSVEDRPIGGLGIHLVKQIMDEVRYERIDNKNILTLVKSL